MKRNWKLKPFVPRENAEQTLLFEWARLYEHQYPELRGLLSTQNGLRTSIGAAVKAKRAGMRPGYPDVILDVPRGSLHGLRIELKRVVGGKLSPDQIWWRDFLQQQGYAWSCCKGFNEARKCILAYLALATPWETKALDGPS